MDRDGAVVTEGLTRVFETRGARRTALGDLDLSIPTGEVHGLLGPNGAGKTTLCKILATVLLPSGGRAAVAGYDVVADPAAVRPRIGIVFGGERGLYTRLTARQNLRYWTALYGRGGAAGRRRADELLERVGLSARADEPVETFSRGMKQRLHLARGLVGDPAVVILDEPTTGMDPVAARDFRGLVGELRGEGRTVLLTTHDMAEAESVCDRVSFLDEGRLLGTGPPAVIGRWISTYERVEAVGVPAELAAAVEALPGVARVERGETTRIETDAEGATGLVLRTLLDAGVTAVSTARPSLEEVYLRVIGDRGLAV
jgi:ABC-2 type transport system ATP-binding protein